MKARGQKKMHARRTNIHPRAFSVSHWQQPTWTGRRREGERGGRRGMGWRKEAGRGIGGQGRGCIMRGGANRGGKQEDGEAFIHATYLHPKVNPRGRMA